MTYDLVGQILATKLADLSFIARPTWQKENNTYKLYADIQT